MSKYFLSSIFLHRDEQFPISRPFFSNKDQFCTRSKCVVSIIGIPLSACSVTLTRALSHTIPTCNEDQEDAREFPLLYAVVISDSVNVIRRRPIARGDGPTTIDSAHEVHSYPQSLLTPLRATRDGSDESQREQRAHPTSPQQNQ